MNFTINALKAVESGLERLSDIRFNWNNPGSPNETYEESFKEDLNNDLNTPQALEILWHLVGHKGMGSRADKMAEILGIKLFNAEISPKIKALKEEYEEYRRNKQFTKSDALREKIKELGYTVRDTETGSIIRRSRK